jgi:glycosyltransferase involved in cell wall biosynthesis
VGCAPALVRDGVTGRLVPPRDAAALADALRATLDDGEGRRRMGDAAAAAVRGMTWRATAERTVAAYERARASATAR